MNVKRLSAIALSNRDFDSFEAKLQEACRWVSLAAKGGAQLAVLPESLNLYCGDGPGNPRALSLAEAALTDWQKACRSLLACASEKRIAVTVPILERVRDGYLNCFHLVSADGQMLGRYVKSCPTPGELAAGVQPGGRQPPLVWEGLRVGGAICFDTNFHDIFARQKADGADLFLCPSLWPGGDALAYHALALQRPIVLAYPAWSRIFDVLGQPVAEGGYRHETLRFGYGSPVITADINFDTAVFHFDDNQDKIEPILRRHGSAVHVACSQVNQRFVLESRSADFTVHDIAREFGLIPLDDYFAAALRKIQEAERSTQGGN
jgi:predicted amidohydrolase